MDWVCLKDFSFPCVIGLLESEQRKTQTLAVELRMAVDLERAAGGDLSMSVDYVHTLKEIMFLAQHGRFRLIESLGVAIARWVLLPPLPAERRVQVQRVRLSLTKPEVFDGLAQPGIRLEKTAQWCATQPKRVAGLELPIDVLVETPITGAYRIWLPAGSTYMSAATTMLHVAAGAVTCAGVSLPWGTACSHPASEVVAGDEGAVLLAVAQPPL